MNTNNNIITEAQTASTSSESTKAQQTAMSEPLRPRWCIQRDNNTVVPLIAIDELPDSVLLKGVPATLTVLEALRARMELITGNHPAHGVRYQLDQPVDSPTVANGEGDEYGTDDSQASEASESSAQQQSATSGKKGNKNASGNGSEEANSKDKGLKAPTLTTNDTSIFDTMAKKGTMGKKVYCTYWIQTGNCNYMQEGCKYKHEIPKDEETRRAIGFREFPNWPREELPVHTKPATALHKSWRRQDGKPELAGAPTPSKRAVASPAAAQGTPIVFARGTSQASAGASTRGPVANAHYNPVATAFAAPHQHFPNHANHMAQQRPFSHGGQPFLGNGAAENYQQRSTQNTPSPPSYHHSAAQPINAGRSAGSSPPKQPPISRPIKQGQTSVGQQQNNTGAPTRMVAPDYHVMNRANGLSDGGPSAPTSNKVQGNGRQEYSGMPNNWNAQTNAPTLMDINFIAPSSDSTRSSGQAIYTPSYTPISASTTPTLHNTHAFATLNASPAPTFRAGTPANHNSTAFAKNATVPVKGRGPIQFGRASPTPSTGGVRNSNLFHPSTTHAQDSDAASITSPPVQHRVFFREPGQPEFVTNPPEPKNGKAVRKHARKAQPAGGTKSAKSKMSGNGYEVLLDTSEQR